VSSVDAVDELPLTFTQYVVISPIPLATIVSSRFVNHLSFPVAIKHSAVVGDTWIIPGLPLLSIRAINQEKKIKKGLEYLM
jgi:hypothetical protein